MTSQPESPSATQPARAAASPVFEQVCSAILEVAPDLSRADLEPSSELQTDLGLDSIDVVNIAAAIEKRMGVEIPDTEFAALHRVGDVSRAVEARCDQKQ